ncbi:MAG: DRTGG domain-containing protein, partial [Dehalococcoidia bacterium]|nr:DRTGG domain-containing protein [Dehalococcoidia bacterium]
KNSSQERLKESLSAAEKGRDVLLLEGAGTSWVGSLVGLSAKSVAQISGAKVLLSARYEGPATADQVLDTAEAVSTSLLGVVINMVPAEAQEFVNKSLAPFLSSRGAPVVGILREERSLMGPTVEELAAYLNGEFLSGADKADNLVEGFLMGALSTDYMQDYYARRSNVAVITSGEKTDIQLFSMTPNTRCIILTGYRRPTELVMAQAAEHGIPLVMVKEDTLSVAERVEGLFAGTRFHQRRKLPIMKEILEAGFDFPALYKALGVTAKV